MYSPSVKSRALSGGFPRHFDGREMSNVHVCYSITNLVVWDNIWYKSSVDDKTESAMPRQLLVKQKKPVVAGYNSVWVFRHLSFLEAKWRAITSKLYLLQLAIICSKMLRVFLTNASNISFSEVEKSQRGRNWTKTEQNNAEEKNCKLLGSVRRSGRSSYSHVCPSQQHAILKHLKLIIIIIAKQYIVTRNLLVESFVRGT